jgi:S1-C subfamily serine protease
MCAFINSASAADLNTIMMEATCKIMGKGTLGTGFVIGKPDPKNPPKAFYTLVTADHVLRAAQSNEVTLVFRQKQKDDSWKRIQVPVQIRAKNKPLWKKHPEMDIAAIFVRLPTNVVSNLVTTDLLIDDQKLKEYEIHPGLELLCLGYPFGAEANAQGFPILRSGRIASYPLTPTKKTKTFLFDFTVFRGNSGGPVYFVQHDPTYGGSRRIGLTIYGIIGIIVRERNITEQIQELYEKREKVTPLQLGEVIHASFIKELVDSMEPPKK